jgi:hypothetical protein
MQLAPVFIYAHWSNSSILDKRFSWRWIWRVWSCVATSCSSEKPRRFGGKRIASACFRWFLAWLTLPPWRWRRYVPPKRRALCELNGVTSQKTSLFNKDIVAKLVELQISECRDWKKKCFSLYFVNYSPLRKMFTRYLMRTMLCHALPKPLLKINRRGVNMSTVKVTL